LYVKDSLHSELCEDLTNFDFDESLWCKLESNNGKGQLLVGACYRCPTSSPENNAKLLELFESANNHSHNSHILVMGDFNFPEINYNDSTVDAGPDSEANKFFLKTEDLYWIQCVTEPTRTRGTNKPSVLDYVFTDEENLIDYVNYESPVGKSDQVCLTWNITVAVGKPDVKQEAKLNYWKGNYDAISDGLRKYDWEMEFRDKTLEQNWLSLKEAVMELVKQFVPLKKPYCGRKSADWMTKETKKLIKDRNRAWTRYRCYSSHRNYLYYKDTEQNCSVSSERSR